MKQLIFFLVLTTVFFTTALCATKPTRFTNYAAKPAIMPIAPHWAGFYLGANAGGWWSTNNSIITQGAPSYFSDPGGGIGSFLDASLLAQIGTHQFSKNASGFIGGGQTGYNYQIKNRGVIGLDVSIQGLTRSNTTAEITQNHLPIGHGFDDFYSAKVSVSKQLNYLGMVRGRLGVLLTPAVLFYGSGGFAYGAASFNTYISATDELVPDLLLPIVAQSAKKQTLVGWVAGGGIEWLFKPRWSFLLEVLNYDLGTLNNHFTLAQINAGFTPPILFAAAVVNASTRFSGAAVRAGVNYHWDYA